VTNGANRNSASRKKNRGGDSGGNRSWQSAIARSHLNTDGTGFRSYPTGSIAAGDKNDRGVSEAMTPSKSRSLDIQTAGESGFYILPRAHADASSCHIYLLKSHRRSPPPRGRSRHGDRSGVLRAIHGFGP